MSHKSCDQLDRFPFIVTHNKLLSDLSTFKIGGLARFYTEVETVTQMQAVLQFCGLQKWRFLIVGKGSNTLFDDRGFDGLVIGNRISFLERPQRNQFYVGAGYSFSRLGTLTAKEGWTGLEFASGIPCSVGGAIFMNAGANGRTSSDSLTSVSYVNLQGDLQLLHRQDIRFDYRSSSFQNMPGAIVAAVFTLNAGPGSRERQMQIINDRKRTQPLQEPSVGCVFRNPKQGCLSAGALIDQAGLKGMTVGRACVSELHANFIVNLGGASAQDVLSLMEKVKERVRNMFGVELESEVRVIPYTDTGDAL